MLDLIAVVTTGIQGVDVEATGIFHLHFFHSRPYIHLHFFRSRHYRRVHIALDTMGGYLISAGYTYNARAQSASEEFA